MNKYLLYILFFLYALNFSAQKIKSVSVDNDTAIEEFLIENQISANDFFIIKIINTIGTTNTLITSKLFQNCTSPVASKLFKLNKFIKETDCNPKLS